jgi:hypothetical protein
MYRKLREETQAAGTPAGHDTLYESYVRFVDLTLHLAAAASSARSPDNLDSLATSLCRQGKPPMSLMGQSD